MGGLRRPEGRGFTLIELLVIMTMLGVLFAMAAFGFRNYQLASSHNGAAQEVTSAMRNAQQRALTEAVNFCVKFDVAANAYSTWRGNCQTGVRVSSSKLADGVQFQAPTFTNPDGSTSTDATFTPRGTASGGSVKIVRSNSSKVYTINLERLTSRVSQS